MKKFYFVAGNSLPTEFYELSIPMAMNTHSRKKGHGDVIHNSMKAARKNELSHGRLTAEQYAETSRMFRITVEEVPASERTDLESKETKQ